MVVEIESTYRVYVKQWFPVIRGPKEEVELSLTQFEGRLKPEEINSYYEEWSDLWVGSVLRWSMNSEWKTESLAQVWAKELDKDWIVNKVVARNSKAEHALINYGVVMLPA